MDKYVVLEECKAITVLESADEDVNQNKSFRSVSSTGTPLRTFNAANKSPNPSFIRASFFYCEAKEVRIIFNNFD
jgi:hypothetical protein